MQTTKEADALLEACVAAFGAFIEHDAPEDPGSSCGGAATRLREAAEAEFGGDARTRKSNRAPVTPARPIEDVTAPSL